LGLITCHPSKLDGELASASEGQGLRILKANRVQQDIAEGDQMSQPRRKICKLPRESTGKESQTDKMYRLTREADGT